MDEILSCKACIELHAKPDIGGKYCSKHFTQGMLIDIREEKKDRQLTSKEREMIINTFDKDFKIPPLKGYKLFMVLSLKAAVLLFIVFVANLILKII